MLRSAAGTHQANTNHHATPLLFLTRANRTTWTAAAVDKRIVGIVPMVMPILNIVPNMNHHYQAYGTIRVKIAVC